MPADRFAEAERARPRTASLPDRTGGISVVRVAPGQPQNASRQRKAARKLTEFQLRCGITVEQFQADMAEQRARVLKRYGVEA